MPLFSPDEKVCFIMPPKCASSYVQTVLSREKLWLLRGRHTPLKFTAPDYEFWATIRDPWSWYESVWAHAERDYRWRHRGITFATAVWSWMECKNVARGAWPPLDNLAWIGDPPRGSLWSKMVTTFLFDQRYQLGAKLIPVSRLDEGLAHHFGVENFHHPVNPRNPEYKQLDWGSMRSQVSHVDGPLWDELRKAADALLP